MTDNGSLDLESMLGLDEKVSKQIGCMSTKGYAAWLQETFDLAKPPHIYTSKIKLKNVIPTQYAVPFDYEKRVAEFLETPVTAVKLNYPECQMYIVIGHMRGLVLVNRGIKTTQAFIIDLTEEDSQIQNNITDVYERCAPKNINTFRNPSYLRLTHLEIL
ncbi:MAG: hypothetical protein ABIC95_00525 [archaeon]